jgi:2,4-dienoyl-CoA reductase-like NADH-dependent reductase (Old Yellow Enzyme family)
MRDKDSTTPVIKLIKEKVSGRTPIIGVGSFYSAKDAVEAFSTDIPLIALGRELIIDPQWVQKMESGRINEIKTEFDPNTQDQLVVPDHLWNAILHSPD